ncbi:MAG TPA: ADP-ribosylglycohydrolase family protein, partial [Solirubrobacteraceae bacterium]|nr:ADP-ribosylglycohydrolase family protein [Solirubrobacteraceae bacterium]
MIGTRQERALLSLEGLSLGDAFGQTFFTEDPLQLVRERRLPDEPWPWTDDTAMAISVVETLAAFEFVNQNDLARRFTARYASEPDRGYGPGTQRILGDVSAGHYWRTASYALFAGKGSYGNGAAMRAPVLGAWFAHDPVAIVEQAHRSAEVTHAHAEGIAGATAVALAAALACR